MSSSLIPGLRRGRAAGMLRDNTEFGEGLMNGAESLVRTLVGGGVNVCFANPGTSEMHFVAALDRVEGMRCVLGLFEGVVTGAADGYFRMKGTPASTLLHLGPGLANGLANLHNAKKAHSGIVNIVGQHATYHIGYNAPLTSDIEGLARPMSEWVRTSPDAKSVAADGAAAIVLADVETALKLNKAIVFRAAQHVQDFLPMSRRDILKFEGCAVAWQRALKEAGIGLNDLSFAEVHDCFTIAELIEYEAMGLVGEGQGARAIAEIARAPFLVESLAARPEDPRQRCPDTRRARSIGWSATVPLHEGLRRTYEWLLTDGLRYAS